MVVITTGGGRGAFNGLGLGVAETPEVRGVVTQELFVNIPFAALGPDRDDDDAAGEPVGSVGDWNYLLLLLLIVRGNTNPSGGKLGKLGLAIGGPFREVMLVTEATLPALSPLSGATCPLCGAAPVMPTAPGVRGWSKKFEA